MNVLRLTITTENFDELKLQIYLNLEHMMAVIFEVGDCFGKYEMFKTKNWYLVSCCKKYAFRFFCFLCEEL